MTENQPAEQAPPQTQEPQGTTPETPPAAAQPTESRPSWAARRIQDLVAERNNLSRGFEEARARAEAAERRLAELNGQQPPASPPASQQPPATEQPPNPPTDPTDPNFRRVVDQRAEELVRIREFNETCNRVYDAGSRDYSDFTAAMSSYTELGGINPVLIEAVIMADVENAHRILYDLAKDKDKAYDLLRMTSPVKLATEVAKLARKYERKPDPKPVSRAPAPPETLRAGAAAPPEKNPNEMTTAEWMAWRNKQKKVR